MKKIPTIFERDWNGDRSRVVDKVNADCQWVAEDEGVAMRKIDGTCCLVRDGQLYKRRELRKGEAPPNKFELADKDEQTGKIIGWMPVGDGPEDAWHREAFSASEFSDGTYELVGPKVQGNAENYEFHTLVSHNSLDLMYKSVPRTFENLKAWLQDKDIEGLVFHHPDGRMAKIKLRDFGLKRG